MATGRSRLLQEFKRSHTLRRTLSIFMAVTVVMFIAVLVLSTNQMVNDSNTQHQRQATASLQQAETLNNTAVRSISDYMLTRLESYEVRGILYGREYTPYLAIHCRDIYDQLTNISDLIHSVQMVNFSTSTVLDHNGRYTFSRYGDQDLLILLGTIEPSNRTRIYYYPRVMNTSASRVTPVQRNVISMIFYLNKAGALVVNLDYASYKNMILAPTVDSPTAYYLINSTGAFFCGTDDELFTASMAEDELYRQMMAADDESGMFTIDDGRRVVNYLHNVSQGASYIAVTEIEGVYIGSPLFWQVIGLAVLFLVASVAISIGLALLTSKPIRALHQSVREQLTEDMLMEETGDDEISFLGNVYQSIMDSNRTLTEKSKLYQIERESQLLLNLMNPVSPSLRASAAAVAELETKLSRPRFRVVALMPDRRRIQMETDAQAIRHGLATTAGEILRTLGTVRTIFPPSFQVLFLINTDDTQGGYLVEKEREALQRILPACQKSLHGMALYMGIGKEVASLDEIAESYSGAEEAVQHAYVRQMTEPAFREELTFPDLNAQAYAFDLDEEITKAVRHMEREDAESAVKHFFERVSGYNHNQFVRSTLHLDVVLQRLEISLQIDHASDSGRIDTATVSHWNAEDACQYFLHRVQMDIAQLQDMKKSNSSENELIEKIDRMIDENIFNPDFSIAQLADEFSFSVNYLRSLYKVGAGESLSTRITRKRVEAACQLLDNTDESIESITMKLGFSTRNYFFTFFKKHMGVTPAQYRNR